MALSDISDISDDQIAVASELPLSFIESLREQLENS
jgi:hypothetical protein